MSWLKAKPNWQENAGVFEAKIKCECGAYFDPSDYGCYSCGRLSNSKEVIMAREVWKYDDNDGAISRYLHREFVRWEEGPK